MTPGRVLVSALFMALLLSVGAVLMLLGRPYAAAPPGMVPVAVGDLTLTPGDLIEEPDQLPDYAAMRDFFARQDTLYSALTGGAEVGFAPAPEMAAEIRVPARPRRLGDLPAPFFFQLGVGALALLIGAWIFALRPRDWGVRMFALTGLCVPVFAMAAAVYSSRFIALPGDLFRGLSGVNHLGAGVFGIGLVGLFLMYPRHLVRPVWLWVPVAVFGIGIALDLTHAVPVKLLDFIVMTQTLLALVLAVVQWVLSRRMPLDRAGLRYLVLATLIGVSCFIGLSVMPVALGLSEQGLLPQGYAFGFFLIMHLGIAMGLARYRVFELDRYAYLVWLWLGSAMLIIGLDALLLMLLHDQPWTSLGLALLVASFVYFPLRQFLFSRFVSTRSVSLAGRMPDILRVAMMPMSDGRDGAWDALLRRIWEPLSIGRPGMAEAAGVDDPSAPHAERATIAEQGLALDLPDCAGVGGRQLRYAAAGRRLFGEDDKALAATLCELVTMIRQSAAAFQRGVTTERDRISRDMHDNIGAQMLSALHSSDAGRKNELLRDALNDLRGIIDAGFTGQFNLQDLMADLRGEAMERLSDHGIRLDWQPLPLPDLPVSLAHGNTLRAVIREAVSNVIRHARCRTMRIAPELHGRELHLVLSDDGSAGASPRLGNGLENMRVRILALRGSISIVEAGPDHGFHIEILVPLDSAEPAPASGAEPAAPLSPGIGAPPPVTP
ncbi:sensor histidine kinase [Pacificitalea manganoxidans]|nr:hypothetical protein [Pacificitalea manganoxidans]MDR6307283.1 signal transduction histidine kinase [Pacificitalea manganoxidans]